MIITTHLNVKIGGKNIKHYLSLGYNVKLYQTIFIPIEHLSVGSNYPIKIECDYCTNIVEKSYRSLLAQRKNSHTKKDCCKNCIFLKNIDTNMDLYDVKNSFQRKEPQEKAKATVMARYGVEYVTQNKEMSKRAADGQKNMSESAKKERYEKTKKTVRERYGVDFVLQLDKTRKGLFKVRSSESSQQRRVFEILLEKYGEKNVFSNYFESKLSLDILVVFDGIKIDVEYDSWYWHNKSDDRRRDEFLKSRGYKILRIKSSRLIPDAEVLFSKLETLVAGTNSFSKIILADWNEEEYEKRREDNNE